MAEFLENHHFEPLVGKTVRFVGTPFTMTFLKITKAQKFIEAAKRDPFLLVFRAPAGGDVYG